MKPPLTVTTKNDVVVQQQPILHNRKTQLINQKEILSDNQQINQQQQYQNSILLSSRNDEISSNYHLVDNFTKLPLITSESQSSALLTKNSTIKFKNDNNSSTTTTQLKTIQKIPLIKNNLNTTENSYVNCNIDSSSSNNILRHQQQEQQQQSTNLIDVPKNIILSNNFEFFDLSKSSTSNDIDDNQLYFSYPTDTKNYLIDNQSTSASIVTSGIGNLINIIPSETEPLLTKNIDRTTSQIISDPQNSICLNKNSASLIFTKKDLSKQFDKSTNNNNNNQNNFNSNNFSSRYNNKTNNLKQNRYNCRRSSGAFTSSSSSCNNFNNKSNNPYKIEPIRRNSVTERNNYFDDNNCKYSNNCLSDIDLRQENRKSLQLNYYSTTSGLGSVGSVIPNTLPTTITTTNKDNLIGTQHTNSTTTASNRKQLAYSWYAPVYSALEEEIEQDSKDTSPIHNLANIKKKNHQTSSDDNETLSLLENNKNQINIQPQLHQPRVRRQVICSSTQQPSSPPPPPPSLATSSATTTPSQQQNINTNNYNLTTPIVGQQQQQQNDNEGPHATSLLAGGPIPRRRRFENFLKSLVGRKPSKETANTIISTNPTNRNNYNTNTTTNNIPSSNLPSPEITITHSPSEHSLFREISRISCTSENCDSGCDDYGGGDCSGGNLLINDDPQGHNNSNQKQITNSTLSLNTVHQKILNIVPILRREGSVSSLYNEKSQSIVQYTGLRKCETVLALSRQSSTYSAVCGNSNCNRNRISGGGGGGTVQIDSHKNDGVYGKCGVGIDSGVGGGGGGNCTNEPIKPLNRLRNSLSTMNTTCSRCSSLLSLAASGSRYSLNIANSGFVTVNNSNCNATRKTSANAILGYVNNNNDNNINSPLSPPPTTTVLDSPVTSNLISTVVDELENEMFICKLCLTEVGTSNESTIIEQCGCKFCTECMKAYVEFEIFEGAYDISCPDAQCPAQGILTILEITALSSPNLIKKHHQYRLNREIEMDKTRMWCPKAGCETICLIGSSTPHNQQQQQQPPTISSPSSTSSPTAITSVTTVSPSVDDKIGITGITLIYCAVQCPTCREEFCSGCKKAWHPNMTCEEFSRLDDSIGIPFDNDLIKCCPMCAVPIEKDEGCAQMMCKRCKHVFCWYCLASLDDDFLLRHYDKGPCKNKLGHSRASVVWHRAQVIGIFAGFGILLLVASPLLLLAAPCIICCKCRICSGAAKIDDPDTDFDEGVALQR